MTTFDAQTREAYCREVAEIDPIMERTVKGGAQVHWESKSFQAPAPNGRFYEFLQDLNLRSGLNIPLEVKGTVVWGVVLTSRSERSLSPETMQQALALSAAVFLKRTLLLGAEAAPRVTDDPRLERLSGDQLEILRWVAQGKSNADIALILGHTKRTVDYHVTQILRKLDVASRTQAAALLAV